MFKRFLISCVLATALLAPMTEASAWYRYRVGPVRGYYGRPYANGGYYRPRYYGRPNYARPYFYGPGVGIGVGVGGYGVPYAPYAYPNAYYGGNYY